MPLIDTFLRGGSESSPFLLSNHTPNAGGTWGVNASGFVISPDGFARNTGGLNLAIWSGDTGSTDYEVAAVGEFKSLEQYVTISTVTRQGTSAGVLHRFYLDNTSGAGRVNMQNAFGSYTDLAGINITGIVVNRSYFVVGSASGTTFTTSVKDLSTGLWLTSSGTFTSTARVAAVTATITHSTAKGFCGFQDVGASTDTAGAQYAQIEYGAVGSLASPFIPASAVTLSGPTTGTTGSPSANFTVGTNNPIARGSVVVTPSDSSGGGTF